MFEDAKRDQGFSSGFDFGEIEVLVVGDLETLARLDTEDASEMFGIRSGELGSTAPDFGYEEASAGHKSSLRRWFGRTASIG